MRHYLVLGFSTSSKEEVGEQLYCGSDRATATDLVNDTSDAFDRKELHELTVPTVTKRFTPE